MDDNKEEILTTKDGDASTEERTAEERTTKKKYYKNYAWRPYELSPTFNHLHHITPMFLRIRMPTNTTFALPTMKIITCLVLNSSIAQENSGIELPIDEDNRVCEMMHCHTGNFPHAKVEDNQSNEESVRAKVLDPSPKQRRAIESLVKLQQVQAIDG